MRRIYLNVPERHGRNNKKYGRVYTGDRYGWSVSISGDYAISGATQAPYSSELDCNVYIQTYRNDMVGTTKDTGK